MTPPSVFVRGRAHAGLTNALISFTVVENTDGLYRCEATFTNWGPVGRTSDFLFFDPRTIDFGMAFRIDAGRPLFEGRVMALEAAFAESAAPTLTVLAEDRLQDLRMTRRTRTFVDMRAEDVARSVAADHGMAAQVDVSGPQHATLVQTNQSDLAFLRSLARAIDAELWVEQDTLHMSGRTRRDAGVVELHYPTTLLECVALADLAHQRTSVTISGWDPVTKSALRHEATEAALADELHGGVSGAKVLASTLGLRKDTIVHTVPRSQDAARAQAESWFKARARRFVIVDGASRDTPDLRVGSSIHLGGLGPRLNGAYYVTGVRHTFDSTRGFRTEFTAESPTLARRAPASVTTRVRGARAVRPGAKAPARTPARRSASRLPATSSGRTSRRRAGKGRPA